MNQREKLMLVIIILLIIAIVIYFSNTYSLLYYFQSEKQKAYNLGVNYGQFLVMAEQMRTGNIFYLENSTGNLTIKSATLQEICGK